MNDDYLFGRDFQEYFRLLAEVAFYWVWGVILVVAPAIVRVLRQPGWHRRPWIVGSLITMSAYAGEVSLYWYVIKFDETHVALLRFALSMIFYSIVGGITAWLALWLWVTRGRLWAR